MLKVSVYSSKGTKLEDFTLPKEFEKEVNLNLLAQASRVYEDLGHFGLRKTKTRSEVNRTKKKVYKQKGTGGARHGSKNAPIFVGGGVAFGPRPISRVLELSQKMRNVAKNMAITLKVKEKEMVLIDGVEKIAKTKEANAVLEKVAKDLNKKKFTFAASEENRGSIKFFRNLANTESISFRNITALNVLKGGILVVDKAVFNQSKKEVKVEKKEVKKVEKKEVKKVAKKVATKKK